MSRKTWISILITAIVCVLLTLFAPAAYAGPELICWPFDIGNAQSLPWSSAGWHATRADYNLNQLAKDTLALLSPDTPVLVRMETLRRAVIYAEKDQRVADEVFAMLEKRARLMETQGGPDGLAIFDLGYFVEAYKQAHYGKIISAAVRGVNGYEEAVRALRLRGNDPQMEFGAALLAQVAGNRANARFHIEKAVAGAADGSLLAANLVTHSHLLRVRAATLAELRAQVSHARN